jgi:hypothetical protein
MRFHNPAGLDVYPTWVNAMPTLSNGFKFDPGIPGGIPAGNADTTLSAGSMTTAGIQNAINAASGRGSASNIRVVQMAAGTYSIGDINPANYVILRGAGAIGAGRTRLNFGTNSGPQFNNGAPGTWPSSAVSISGTLPLGSTQMTVGSTATFAVGDIIQIDQIDDLSYVALFDGVYHQRNPNLPDNDGWRDRGPRSTGGFRSVSSLHKITNINASVVTFDPPTRIEYNSAFTPECWRVARQSNGEGLWYFGLEDFSMAGPGSGAIQFHAGAHCWVKGVETDGNTSTGTGIDNDHITFIHQFRSEIRNSYCHHSRSGLQSGGASYGINLNDSSSDCLVIDNISMWFCKPLHSNSCGPGNVIAYNFATNTSADGGAWMDGAVSASHSTFSHNMLFEGNYGANLACDSTHGVNGYIIYHRNYGHGQNQDFTSTGFLRAAGVDGWSRETAWVGNVLFCAAGGAYEVNGCTNINAYVGSGPTIWRIGQCTWGEGGWNELSLAKDDYTNQSTHPPTNNLPSDLVPADGRTATYTSRAYQKLHRHGNWDRVTNGIVWDGGFSSHSIPNSLFLSSKPSFFGANAWPWVDPSSASIATPTATLPAKYRYDQGTYI